MYENTENTGNELLWFLIIGLGILVLFLLFVKTSKKDESKSHPLLGKIKEDLTFVHPTANQIYLLESTSSFTEDKKYVHLCLKNKDGQYYSYNTLMFVALHELAHVLSTDIGHGPQWERIFGELLKRGEQLGLYNPSIPLENNYCGIVIEQ